MLKDDKMVTVLPAADLERAKKFYVEKIGLHPKDTGAPDTIYFENGDGPMFILYKHEGGGTKADHTVASWLVDDVEKSVEQLTKRGVTFEQYDMPNLKTDRRGIAELGDEKSAWFKDTEGNILAISETLE